MALEKQPIRSGPRCPDHPDAKVELIQKEIRTGYDQTIRKVMIIGKCTFEGCTRWCEVSLALVIWN